VNYNKLVFGAGTKLIVHTSE
uniref:Uncharacterized protein n=1 Tax=Myripristis murdjan TaxID=586833 RepID=A0A668AEL4_9TELE